MLSHVQIKNIRSTLLQRIELIDYIHYDESEGVQANVLGSNHGAIGWPPDIGGGPPEGHDKNHRN